MKHSLKDLKFSKQRIIAAVVIFISTSITYYAFLYMCRETVRYFSITPQFDIWVLSDQEVFYYNSIFAAIALVLGLGSAGSFLVDRPSFHKGSIRHRTNILNDFKVLNWLFNAWALKIAFAFGMLFCSFIYFDDMHLYPEYNYMMVLIVIVLYLQLWTSLRRAFTISIRKVFIPTTIAFILLSMLMGKINFIDYNKLNDTVLSKNPYHVLNIEKPTANFHKRSWKYNVVRQFYLGYPKSEENPTKPQLMYDGKAIDFNDVDTVVAQLKKRVGKGGSYQIRFQLNIDNSVKMKYVNELRTRITKTGVYNIGYAIMPADEEGSQMRFRDMHIPWQIPDYDLLGIPDMDEKQVTELYQLGVSSGQYVINDKSIIESMLIDECINILNDTDSTFVFKLDYQEDISFKQFFKIFNAPREAIMTFRDEYSLATYDKEFRFLSRDEKKKVLIKYPMVIYDRDY